MITIRCQNLRSVSIQRPVQGLCRTKCESFPMSPFDAEQDREPWKGVFVLGMHRSGASMMARVVNLLGSDAGDPADRIGPAPDNPAGF